MSLLADLRAALGDGAVLEGEAMGQRPGSDMSLTGTSLPRALIRPRSTDEVATALNLCNTAGVPVIAQGGMTGLAGGANPGGSEIAISLERLRGIEEVDVASATMVVKAGTPLEECQRAAAEAGLFLALDLGSRGSCTIGGNLSTNAGGIRVIRYGMAREQVLGLEAVLADGTIISSMNRMLKNNAGYDLKQLFIGSEGTLGLITRAVLRLHPPTGEITTMLCAVQSYEQVVALLRAAQSSLGGIVAFEAMWRDYFSFNANALKLRFFEADHPFWVIVESTMAAGAIETFLAQVLEDGLITDALIARSHAQSREMWSVRDGHPIEALPNLLNFDVSLPIGKIGDYAEVCTVALKQRWPDAHVSFYGHVGDSNVHICVSTLYAPGEDMHSVDDIVYGVLGRYHGSISAEHGIGTLKRPYLHLSRSAAELALMRSLKQALDPKGILNPGKVI
ncbi:MAG: FAD-binding oxidoreductase [Aestuariivirga sp.]|uniref:FAD-binding oxidoreductase n=1 Tax=Aestuariivirga sp. TaxID=2650926 RepID=UPI0030181170